MLSNEQQLQREFGQILGLEDTEAETMVQIIKGCATSYGVVLGTTTAVGTSGAGAVFVPVVGSVPGWLAGFAAGFVTGTLACTMYKRGIVIEGLKRAMQTTSTPVNTEAKAIAQLKGALRHVGANIMRTYAS